MMEYGGHGGPATVPSTLSHVDIFYSKMLPAAPILNTAPGSGGPWSAHSGLPISGSMSKAYLTMYEPGHLIAAMALLKASKPTQGIAKVIPRPSVGMSPTSRGQSATGNPFGSIGNSPASHEANAMGSLIYIKFVACPRKQLWSEPHLHPLNVHVTAITTNSCNTGLLMNLLQWICENLCNPRKADIKAKPDSVVTTATQFGGTKTTHNHIHQRNIHNWVCA